MGRLVEKDTEIGRVAAYIVKAVKNQARILVVFTSLPGIGRAVYLVPPSPSSFCLKPSLEEARIIGGLLEASYLSVCRVSSLLYSESIGETLGALIDYGVVDYVEDE